MIRWGNPDPLITVTYCQHLEAIPRRSVDRWDEDEVSGRWCPTCGAILNP